MRLPPWMWKVMQSRKTKIFLASAPFVFCLLVLLFYFGTSWWGRSRAQRLLKDYESAGYAVDPEKYWLPAANPQDDLCQDPLVLQEFENPVLTSLGPGYQENPLLARRLQDAEPRLARPTELTRWVKPTAPDDRTAAGQLLKVQHAAVQRLEALRPALSSGKEVVWPVKIVPHEGFRKVEAPSVAGPMIRLHQSARAAGEIAIFHLATGDRDRAAEAVEAMLDVARLELDPKPALTSVISTEPTLRRTQTAIWEGVVRGGWSDGQLQAFDESLAALDPQQAAVESHLGEIAMLRAYTTVFWATPVFPKVEIDWPDKWKWDPGAAWEETKETVSKLQPPGLKLAKGVASWREFLDRMARVGGAPRVRFTPQDLKEFRRMAEESRNAESIYFVSAGDALSELATVALRMETTIALTRTGIALERYRLRDGNGSYPASLAVLVPDFLPEVPMDPFGSLPLSYKLQADGSPHVWSVGGNFTDDGGLPHSDFTAGDLIWITRPIPGFTQKDFIHR